MKKIYIDIPEFRDILFYELQSGFYLISLDGVSVRTFLKDFCHIPQDYIKDKIKTIFHNGNPVDNLDAVYVRDGSTLALSGAMPGLVGAMMRIQSPYAVMRDTITDKGGEVKSSGKDICVRLKLFNVVLNDLGFDFIERGIILDKTDLLRILKKLPGFSTKGFVLKTDDLPMTVTDIEISAFEKFTLYIEEAKK